MSKVILIVVLLCSSLYFMGCSSGSAYKYKWEKVIRYSESSPNGGTLIMYEDHKTEYFEEKPEEWDESIIEGAIRVISSTAKALGIK